MRYGLILFIISFQLLAEPESNPRREGNLVDKAYRVANKIERNFYELDPQEKRIIRGKLNDIVAIINGDDGRPGPGPRPPSDNRRVVYESHCWIDDDPDFTAGQYNGGILTGDFMRMIKDCKQRAHAMFGNSASFSLKNVKAIQIPRGLRLQSAMCHIDDDPDFTYGQIIIGRLYASNIPEIKAQCLSLAKATYKSRGSAGVKDFR